MRVVVHAIKLILRPLHVLLGSHLALGGKATAQSAELPACKEVKARLVLVHDVGLAQPPSGHCWVGLASSGEIRAFQ